MAVGTLALAACGELSPAEQARTDAVLACSDWASTQFPVLKDIPNMKDEQSADEFRVDANGAFVWIMTVRGKGRPLADRLSCRGNVNVRAVESVELNGVVKRPQAQEVWKY